MDLTKINQIAREAETLPLKKMSDLEVRKYYQITSLRRVKPQFSYIVNDSEENFAMYLPKYMATALNNDPAYFQKMARAAERNQLQMRYAGNNKIEFNYNLEDKLEKLAIKCPKPQPVFQPGPSANVNRKTMDLTKINKVARGSESLPLKKMSDLKVLEDYQITNFRREKKQSGNGIVVKVDEAFEVFLPTQVAEVLNEDGDLLRKMVQATKENRLQMRYLGDSQIEFIDNPEDESRKLAAKWPPQSPNQPDSIDHRGFSEKPPQAKIWDDFSFFG